MNIKTSKNFTLPIIQGIAGLFSSLLPLLGYPINILGLIFNIIIYKKYNKRYSKNCIILFSIGLIMTLVNSIVGVIIYSKK